MHYVVGKGDWKYKKEWLAETRFWSQGTSGICRRCFAKAGNWADFVWMQDWNPSGESAIESAFGPIPLKNLAGWNPNMEFADILHVVWCGLARDVSGSLLLETAEHAVEGDSYDDRLKILHQKCVSWCRANKIRPSTVEEFSA